MWATVEHAQEPAQGTSAATPNLQSSCTMVHMNAPISVSRLVAACVDVSASPPSHDMTPPDLLRLPLLSNARVLHTSELGCLGRQSRHALQEEQPSGLSQGQSAHLLGVSAVPAARPTTASPVGLPAPNAVLPGLRRAAAKPGWCQAASLRAHILCVAVSFACMQPAQRRLLPWRTPGPPRA